MTRSQLTYTRSTLHRIVLVSHRGWVIEILKSIDFVCLLIKLKHPHRKRHDFSQRAIMGLLSQFAHPRSLNTGAPGCLAGNIVGISDAVYPYLTIPDHF